MRQSLEQRMKKYEAVSKTRLMTRTPVIIRLDGRAFHTLLKGFQKPFDPIFRNSMAKTLKYLCENIQGCVFGYTQSDEITLVLVDYNTLDQDCWFDYEVQKIVSCSASMATLVFDRSLRSEIDEYAKGWNTPYLDAYYKALEKGACFDARAFNLSKEEVANNLIWRQKDAIRNSIQSTAQTYFQKKELPGISCEELVQKLKDEKNISWNDYAVSFKRGVCCYKITFEKIYKDKSVVSAKWMLDYNTPLFTENRDYIEKWIQGEKEEYLCNPTLMET